MYSKWHSKIISIVLSTLSTYSPLPNLFSGFPSYVLITLNHSFTAFIAPGFLCSNWYASLILCSFAKDYSIARIFQSNSSWSIKQRLPMIFNFGVSKIFIFLSVRSTISIGSLSPKHPVSLSTNLEFSQV